MSKPKTYQIMVHVQEAREIKNPDDKNNPPNPMVQVTVGGRRDTDGSTAIVGGGTSQNTSVVTDAFNAVWDTHFMFNLDLTDEDFERDLVTLTVMNSGYVMNTVIGTYALELSKVRGQTGHEYYGVWLGMTRPSDPSEVMCFLQCSVAVYGPGDTPAAHGEGEDGEMAGESDLNTMLLLPPQVRTVYMECMIQVFKAEDLPVLGTFGGGCDGYVVCRIGSYEQSTPVVSNNLNPTWNTTITLPVTLPTMNDRIDFELYDRDATRDEFIGRWGFKFSDVLVSPIYPTWVNIYGPPRDHFYTNAAEIAPCAYLGRVLMRCSANRPKGRPKLATSKCPPVSKDPQQSDYFMNFDVFEAIDLPLEVGDAMIEVSIGSISVKSEWVDVENFRAHWDDGARLPAEGNWIEKLPRDIKQVPDIIITLWAQKSPVHPQERYAYMRLPANGEGIVGFEHHTRWHMLTNTDLTKPDNFAGSLLYRLDFGPIKEGAKVQKQKMDRFKLKKYELRAYIFQIRDLPAANIDGLCDPFVKIRMAGKEKDTAVQQRTRFPQYLETITLENLEMWSNLKVCPELHILVYDHDDWSQPDMIARAMILACDIPKKIKKEPIVPSWIPLHSNEGKHATVGHMLAAFELVPVDETARIPSIDLQTDGKTRKEKDAIIEIQTIGLRRMQPFGWGSPCNNPTIHFDVGNQHKQLEPWNKPNGANANFLETIKIPLKLPEDPAYAPVMTVRVFDDETLVGTTCIQIAEFIPWTPEKNNATITSPKLAIKDAADGASEEEKQAAASQQETISAAIESTKDAKKDQDDAEEAALEGEVEEEEDQLVEYIDEEVTNYNMFTHPQFATFTIDDKLQPQMPDVDDTDVGGADEADEPLYGGRLISEYELENHSAMKSELPFRTWPLFMGKMRQPDWQDSLRVESKYKEVGIFKGQILIYDKLDASDYNSGGPKEQKSPDLKEKFKAAQYVVRAYVLKGHALSPLSYISGRSNPYLVLRTNGFPAVEIDDADNAIDRNLEPEFFRCYEFAIEIGGDTGKSAGHSELSITINDAGLTGAEIIGETIIDLEQRVFSEGWKSIEKKPVEFRSLWKPGCSAPQGSLEMWLEILDLKQAVEVQKFPLVAPNPEPFIVRAVIWQTDDVPIRKDKTIDIMCSMAMDPTGTNSEQKQETDVHWRSDNGHGEFNWRFIFEFFNPCVNPRLKVQLWSYDIVGSNEAVSEANLNLKAAFDKAKKIGKNHKVPKQFIDFQHPAYEGVQGKVQISMQIMPLDEAIDNPVGIGRDDPNQDPFLPKPDRPSMFDITLPSFDLFGGLIAKMRRLCCFCCIAIAALGGMYVTFMM